jgi:sugar phosphate isomerase/epimerase
MAAVEKVSMFLGYNTNGFAHHRLDDAIEIIAELGYGGVAVTPDVNHDPHGIEQAVSYHGQDWLARMLARQHLKCVIESGGRFVLDRWRKHQPTLVSPAMLGRERLSYLCELVELAAELKADLLSFWSGTPTDDAPHSELMNRLVGYCSTLADYAAERNVRLAFEPEPGMFIDTMDKFAELHAKVNHPHFGLTIDVGHLVCNGEMPVSEHLVRWKDWLWNVHIEDMRRGVHDHLMFGEGEVDFADVFDGLRRAGYANGVFVELSRHSHDAVNTARKSKAFLDRFMA